MSSHRVALEAALARDPNDLATHAAYADLLAEEGDPRGEYIRLQLALEDHDQPADHIQAMEQQAFELLQEHECEWLGPLAQHIYADLRVPGEAAVTWRRGWVHALTIHLLEPDLQHAIATAPVCRLLTDLTIRFNQTADLAPLSESPNVRNLRSVELGCPSPLYSEEFVGDAAALLRQTPRLEQLRITNARMPLAPLFAVALPKLHTLRVTTANADLPVAALGGNPSLGRLTRLDLEYATVVREPLHVTPDDFRSLFSSPYLLALRDLALYLEGFGDDGVDALIASGMLTRLQGLILNRCDITDDGAQALANCPAITGLEYLRLDYNHLSPVGINALSAVGGLVCERQRFLDWPGPEPSEAPPM